MPVSAWIATILTLLWVFICYFVLEKKLESLECLSQGMSLFEYFIQEMSLNEIGDFLAGFVSPVAFIWLVAGYYQQAKSWLQSNRPIVSVFLDLNVGNVSSTCNLVVENTGNRPAVNVVFFASPNEIHKLFSNTAAQSQLDDIKRIFDQEKTVIPLLREGEQLSTAFGAIAKNNPQFDCLQENSSASIKVMYKDLEGRKYNGVFILKVSERKNFSGLGWAKNK